MAKPCIFKRTLDGSNPTTMEFCIASGKEVESGQLVTLCAGSIQEAEPSSDYPILGVAEMSATSGTIPVQVNLQAVYEGNLDVNSAIAYAGVKCDVDSGTILDPSDTTQEHVMLLKPVGTNTDKRQEFIILNYAV